ncbi:DUF6249 domain-containing protein [Kordiimonas sp. SCSIO 12610]|uniref:DUF6249 domain-containing protein n=1 Tax=Kordiimonas sp. SCSIO 12610 TaxID=2829597 RepID=UPI00210B5E49|nr:DUF6249 domain-containing protein [Kordiimonas sp. SCSIO 12610]UTW55834.1 hypothetical protein KFF44_02790 [Kordiimonas sp. SCSIO 12610]
MEEEVFIFITMFLVIGACISVLFFSRYKHEQLRQRTLQKALDAGQQLTPELLESLGKSTDTGVRDYRRGILVTLFGVALLVFSLLADIDKDVRAVFPYLSLFPIFIGLGYLFVWKTKNGQQG